MRFAYSYCVIIFGDDTARPWRRNMGIAARALRAHRPVGCAGWRSSSGGGVVMEAAPSAAFVVPEADLLLDLQVVALDAPAQLGDIDEATETGARRKRRQPVPGRLGFAVRPFDQQPLLCQGFRQHITMRSAYAHARKPRRQPVGRAFSPPDRAPGMVGQTKRQRLRRDQIGFVTTPGIVQRSTPAPRTGAGWKHQDVRLNAA